MENDDYTLIYLYEDLITAIDVENSKITKNDVLRFLGLLENNTREIFENNFLQK